MKYLLLSLLFINCNTTEKSEDLKKVTAAEVQEITNALEPCNNGIRIKFDLECKLPLNRLINIKNSNKRCQQLYTSEHCVRSIEVKASCHVNVKCGVPK